MTYQAEYAPDLIALIRKRWESALTQCHEGNPPTQATDDIGFLLVVVERLAEMLCERWALKK